MAKRRTPITSAVAVAFLAVISVAYLWAEPDYSPEFPQGYRNWTHVMSYVIGPQSPAYERNGGLHNFYANEKALQGYRTGKFPDGSILIDERNRTEEKVGVMRTGDFLGVGVMIKDSQRYAETGGWGFEVFVGNNQTNGVLNAQSRMGCYNCHLGQKDQDFVFTKLRE